MHALIVIENNNIDNLHIEGFESLSAAIKRLSLIKAGERIGYIVESTDIRLRVVDPVTGEELLAYIVAL